MTTACPTLDRAPHRTSTSDETPRPAHESIDPRTFSDHDISACIAAIETIESFGQASAEPLTAAERDTMVTDLMPLVRYLVRTQMASLPPHVSAEDLSAAGMEALVRASRSFDPTIGVAFKDYADHRVRGAILDQLRSQDWASRSVRRRARDIAAAREEIRTATFKQASNAEIADHMGISLAEVEANARDVHRSCAISLDRLLAPAEDGLGIAGSDSAWIRSEQPMPEDVVMAAEQMAFLRHAIAELPDNMRKVITEHYLLQRPMIETAADLGVSESRISQIRAEGIVLLRAAMEHSFASQDRDPEPKPGVAARRRANYVRAVDASYVATLRSARNASVVTEALTA